LQQLVEKASVQQNAVGTAGATHYLLRQTIAPADLNSTVQLLAHARGQTFIDLAQQLLGQGELVIRQLSSIRLQPQIGACRKAEEEQKAGQDSNSLPAPMARNLGQRARMASAGCMSVARSSGSCSRMCRSPAPSWPPGVPPPLATKLAASSRASSTTLSLPM